MSISQFLFLAFPRRGPPPPPKEGPPPPGFLGKFLGVWGGGGGEGRGALSRKLPRVTLTLEKLMLVE